MIFLPILFSFIAALLTGLCHRKISFNRGLSLAMSALVCGSSFFIYQQIDLLGPQSIQFGDWAQPFGISFYIDTLSALLLVVSSCIGLCGNIVAIAMLSPRIEARGFHPLYHFMMAGVLGAFSTGDLFNLYVWFEIILISSFIFVAMSREGKAFAGAFKYSTLSIMSSLLFLIGIAFTYSSTGTLDLRDLAFTNEHNLQGSQNIFAVIFLALAFSIKSGLFPFYFWLPASYPSTVTPMAAVFSGLLTKVGVYALLRVLVAPLLRDAPDLLPYLYVSALASMLLGVFAALAQNNIKGILSAHIISQVGYIVLGLSIGTFLGVMACVFYLVHHIVVKTNLFFVSAYIERITRTKGQLVYLGNLWKKAPLAVFLFSISALSLIGVPPLSGFWAKVMTLQAMLSNESWVGFVFCLGISFLTLMSMLKIWMGTFWKTPLGPVKVYKLKMQERWVLLPIICLSLWTVYMGLDMERYKDITEKISSELHIERIVP